MNNRVEAGIAAAVGGVAPSLLALAIHLTNDAKPEMPTAGYYAGLVVFALLGFLVARWWNEKVPRRALFLGIGLPALLHVGNGAYQKQGPPPVVTPPVVERANKVGALVEPWPLFSTSAWAQEAPQPKTDATKDPLAVPPLVNRRRVILSFDSVPSDTQLVVMTTHGDTPPVHVNWFAATQSGAVAFALPEDAVGLKFVSGVTRNTPTMPLQNKQTQTLKLTTETDFTAGFLKAMGFKSTSLFKVTSTATAK